MTNITVDKVQWESLDRSEKERILDGLKQCGALSSDAQIVGIDDAEIFDEKTALEPMSNPIGDICRFACDKVVTAGMDWCTKNTNGIALAVCLAAAKSAGDECKKKC